MKVGFTGTHFGMKNAQREQLRNSLLLAQAAEHNEFHHGDCIGADHSAASIAQDLGYWVVAHPPTNPYRRAYFLNDDELPAKPYIERDHDIVDVADIVLATPFEFHMMARGGTWATIRYAWETKKKITIIYPDGSVSE